MDLVEHLRGAHERYLALYRGVIRDRRATESRCIPELWIEPNRPPGTPKPPHPLCADIFAGTPEQPRIIQIEEGDGPPTGAFVGVASVQSATVRVYPIAWSACRVRMRHPAPQWTALEAWREKWMNWDDPPAPDEDGLSGIVHHIGAPEAQGGGFAFELDLGSAPPAALIELLEVFIAMGATELELGLSDGSDLHGDLVAQLGEPLCSPRRLTELVAAAIESLPEIESVHARPDADSIEVRSKLAPGEHTVNLANLHARLAQVDPALRPREILRFIDALRDALGPRPPLDLQQLRPVIKDARWIEMVEREAGRSNPWLARRLVGDLWIVCAWDLADSMQFVTEQDVSRLELTEEAVIERATDNYVRTRPEVETETRGLVSIARTGDCYEASLLLDDDFWDAHAGDVPLLACVPSRDCLMFGPGRPGTVDEMRRIAREVREAASHPVSETIVVRRDGEWEVFAQADAPNGERGGDAVSRRPWWKFW